MLGRFGEGQHDAPQELLDRRQIAAVAATLVTMVAGIVAEYALRAPPLVQLHATGPIGCPVTTGPI